MKNLIYTLANIYKTRNIIRVGQRAQIDEGRSHDYTWYHVIPGKSFVRKVHHTIAVDASDEALCCN